LVAIYGSEFIAVVCFLVAFQRFGVVAVAQGAIRSGINISHVMRDRSLSDDQKEQAARRTSLVLLRDFGVITLRSGAALAVSFLPVFVMDVAGIAPISAVNRLMLSWNGIVFASAVAAVVYFVTMRR
jgi:hypothetical protein